MTDKIKRWTAASITSANQAGHLNSNSEWCRSYDVEQVEAHADKMREANCLLQDRLAEMCLMNTKIEKPSSDASMLDRLAHHIDNLESRIEELEAENKKLEEISKTVIKDRGELERRVSLAESRCKEMHAYTDRAKVASDKLKDEIVEFKEKLIFGQLENKRLDRTIAEQTVDLLDFEIKSREMQIMACKADDEAARYRAIVKHIKDEEAQDD